MRAKALSLSAPQERKSKVALNCIIRAVLCKGRVFHLPDSFIAKGRKCVSISDELTEQI